MPVTFTVSQNYPNPFNPNTEIKYGIPSQEKIEIVIFNILGQRVKTLVNREQEAGYYKITWDSTNDFGKLVSSGLYFYSIKAGKNHSMKKMMVLK